MQARRTSLQITWKRERDLQIDATQTRPATQMASTWPIDRRNTNTAYNANDKRAAYRSTQHKHGLQHKRQARPHALPMENITISIQTISAFYSHSNRYQCYLLQSEHRPRLRTIRRRRSGLRTIRRRISGLRTNVQCDHVQSEHKPRGEALYVEKHC